MFAFIRVSPRPIPKVPGDQKEFKSQFEILNRVCTSGTQEGEKMAKLVDIEGIGPAYASKLAKAGIRSVEGLLKKGASPKGRKGIATASGIDQSKLQEWVKRADLYRIKGIGKQYSDLLEKAGVDSAVELSKRVPGDLHAKIVEVNQARNLVNRLPSLGQVQFWVTAANQSFSSGPAGTGGDRPGGKPGHAGTGRARAPRKSGPTGTGGGRPGG
jgi:predicted flap endonuclease-1-like 5' DNA nuclease